MLIFSIFFQNGNKGFEQAALFVGKFLKAKALKKSDDDILAGFGAERDMDDEDEVDIAGAIKSPRGDKQSANIPAFAKKKGFGRMLSKVTKAQR